jgi:putative ABC transport system substrate-binding protein
MMQTNASGELSVPAWMRRVSASREVMTLSVVGLMAVLTLGLFATPPVALAQQAGKVNRIGYLRVGSPGGDPLTPVFEQALRERGWVTGENLVIEYRYAHGKYERLPALAAELVRLDPQVIVTVTVASAQAAKAVTSTIPVVMWGVGDPISAGLVTNLARPGGNVTGFTDAPFETYAKQLQLLKQAVPRARRFAFLVNPASPAVPLLVKTLKEAAKTLGIELQVIDARTPEAFESAFRTMAQARVEALLVADDATFFRHFGRLTELSLRHRLPTMCGNWSYATAGGLMNYSVDRANTVRQVAGYVDRLLRGANPAELPVEQPTKFILSINLKTAKALGVTIPSALLVQANEVIK